MSTSASHTDKSLSRKEREHAFRVNLVLDAAEEVFGEAAFAQASVEDIAERAEISVGTLYNLFRSKEDIYRSVVSRSQNEFFELMKGRVDDARGPRDKIHAAVSYYFEHFHRYGRQMRLYASATNGFQWDLKSKLTGEALASQEAFRMQMRDICQEGLDVGMFKKGVAADLLATTILGIPHAFLLAWMETEGGEDLVSMLPAALAIVDRLLGTDVS